MLELELIADRNQLIECQKMAIGLRSSAESPLSLPSNQSYQDVPFQELVHECLEGCRFTLLNRHINLSFVGRNDRPIRNEKIHS